ncbi:SGNH/GDSL hydrolase family protein [Wenyingzhuangia sp. chi5]|uniref:SGNH/GDSL hydrolase family protein n=1 Tax=Wenyingzhuangia gilva TaxID=3057677 RepID=A0ABT8VPP4_9FLAO|nr:SGNH/GDSL hydrolase family protein [Wenyingzhuangia sp. chi5]MDO3693921.1 SGNH/GDSL hydrolase family protein [Wenyingzhuangia sp. chi5]
MRKLVIIFLGVLFCVIGCGSESITSDEIVYNPIDGDVESDSLGLNSHYKILALGDSYTIGQSVCNTCSFPEQLKQKLLSNFFEIKTIDLKIVAKTGWRTNNLINSLEAQEIDENYNFVTLLIGVNNQFQGASFGVYEREFPELVNKAITYANNNANHLVVLSIPDYTYTPYGSNFPASEEIAAYNKFARDYCINKGVSFLNITDITEQGLEHPELVADDDLHPSAFAYEKFVKRLLPLFVEKMTN